MAQGEAEACETRRLNSHNLTVHDGRFVSDAFAGALWGHCGVSTHLEGCALLKFFRLAVVINVRVGSREALVAPVTSQRGDLQNTLS